jgi:COP9 signalosome complex subunit 1
VRSKALVQYVSPFVSVDMSLMATAFNVAIDALEKELAKLIMAQHIPARIDSQANVLYARHADQRTATFTAAHKAGEEHMRDMRALLLRMNLMRADFIVKGEGHGIGPSKSSRQEGRAAPVHHSAMSGPVAMEGS